MSYNATILENSVAKTYISAEDKMGIYLPEAGLNIRYKVTGGDNSKMFRAEERIVGDFCFLLIRTRSWSQSVINRERQDVYRLSVKATAKQRNGPNWTTRTDVILRVLDANDLSPLFYPRSYDVSISEDTTLHSSVVQVTASDADVGINGEVYFSFLQRTDAFAIHPTSGLVTLTRPLSFIDQNIYELQVLAQDRGPSLGSGQKAPSRASLTIRVTEVNFFSPQIKLQQLPAVEEHGQVGTVYAILYVNDEDYGDNGEILSMEIVAGDPEGIFELKVTDPNKEFALQVAKILEEDSSPVEFNLTVEASDRGQPPRSTQKEVYVKLWDKNQHMPVFEHDEYSVSVEECIPPRTPLKFISAKNRDAAYSISQGNHLNWFTVDSRTGLLSVLHALDRETVDQVELVIAAQHRRHTASVNVTVLITDCNDNTPAFNSTAWPEVSVQEGAAIGSSVYQVHAMDADLADNGQVSYSLSNVNSVPFTIDHFTGEIKTKQVLDFETMRRVYSLVVRASDWGSPFRRESESILKVRLQDQNDNKPQFEKEDCSGYLSREAPVGTELLLVSAIDFDAGNIISYEIVSGNDDDCFDLVSSTGSLSTKCELTAWTQESHSVVITATDGVHTAEPMTVNISFVNNNRNLQLSNNDAKFMCRDTKVTEEYSELLRTAEQNNVESYGDLYANAMTTFSQNMHVPRFSSSTPSHITVAEDVALGEDILVLSAADEDHGYNSLLTFVISEGNVGHPFVVSTYGGRLQLQRALDRELRDSYTLNITVWDMGQPAKASYTLLDVRVIDVNDNAPQFQKMIYNVTIPENIDVNRTIVSVKAYDDDEGTNARVMYSILSDTKDFTISPDSGVIKVNQQLDRETIPWYELQVVASDGALEKPLSSTVLVSISLADINDNPPQFFPESYSIRIREDLPVGVVILTLTANDLDLGADGMVRYALIEGMDDKFEIDRLTGTIRIVNPLDFESKQLYNIIARARDRSTPALSTKCSISIEIVDVNENLYPPVFKDFVFQGRVKENQPPNTSVMRLVATDADTLQNPLASRADSQIVYTITGGSGMRRFTIDNSGVIRTHGILDRESQAHYWLRVVACDRGTVPLCSTVEVLVEVEDLNDNVPQTEFPVYEPMVPENSDAGHSVVNLEARDADDSKNNQLTYSIVSGDPQGFFSIDEKSGLITTTSRRLDREQQAEHILEVRISDNGVPSLSSTTRVVVKVTDVNDLAPQFTESVYRVRVPAMPQPTDDVDLFRVVAFDLDEGANADIDFSLKNMKNQNRFSIHPKTGMISSSKEFEAGTQYDITVQAVDNGDPQKVNQVRVFFSVVDRPVTSANPPRFNALEPVARVMEDDPVGTSSLIVGAEDDDGDKIWFSISDGNEDDTFSIDPENGNVLLAKALDWETRNEYNITVRITDMVFTAHTTVLIQVLDINDHAPQFSQSEYSVGVSESTPAGVDILTLEASDLDEDKRLFFTILSASDQSSIDKFKINSETGVITTRERLDREAASHHQLVVMVRDQGTPSKRSLARVVIVVNDHNDHHPEFVTSEVEGRVYGSAEIGTQVLTVLAVDRDHGHNAQLKYSIVSGNIGTAFSMDPSLGVLSVAKPLLPLGHNRYDLQVRAADGGAPSLSSTASVTVFVTTASNAAPRFHDDEYTVEIAENLPEMSFVASIQADSQSSVVYDIIRGNELGKFGINPSSGVIYSRDELDYEQNEFFNLTIKATNMARAWSSTLVLVHVVDENDNAPVFVMHAYSGNVSEASPEGSVVLDADNTPLVIKASDMDTNSNALLRYSIVEPEAAQLFDIDASTGSLKTKVTLDHEVAAVYEFSVQVQDSGVPSQSAMTAAQVTVHVMDINDSPPQFSEPEYSVRLLLPTYPNVLVSTVVAHDADTDVNTELLYSITEGNDLEHFALDPTEGTLRVVDSREMLDSYLLTIRVTDGLYDSTAQVKVSVDFTEDSGLSFSDHEYYAEIKENSTAVSRVAIVQASGHALNEHLTFSILNPSDMFSIGATSGVVTTAGKAFDREVQDEYTVVVEARDSSPSPRVAHVLLRVRVIDTNDNFPMFVNQPYMAIVSLDATRGQVVYQVKAIDRDIGENGQVAYSIIEGAAGLFSMQVDSGHIILDADLTLEHQNQQHKLTVEAHDRGAVPLSVQTTVSILVMSRATPSFDQPFYQVDISESLPIGSVAVTIHAQSPTGGKLIYSITAGDKYDEFGVHFSTVFDVDINGSITIADKLDYELITSYQLTVRATDIDTGSFAEAAVHINLQDENDHPPRFTSNAYTVTVSEVVAIGTPIITVTTTDRDSGVNALAHYELREEAEGGAMSNHFHIDTQQGTVFTKQRLDHEHYDQLSFLVIATDHGIPPLSSEVRVRVVITDMNDNPPRFDHPAYEVAISDLAERGQFVTSVMASDDDASDVGRLTYSIVGGNTKQTFMLDEFSGVLSLSNLRKPSLDERYLLNISVTDGVFTNFATVHISVDNSNLHDPVFLESYDIYIAENLPSDTFVAAVSASDEDRGDYGSVSYSIVSEEALDLFWIDETTGEIFTLEALDREKHPQHLVPVAATDGGGRMGYVTVIVNVADQGDSEPQFKLQEYKANVFADAEIGSVILKVEASDDDLGPNGDLVYALVDSGITPASEVLAIDPVSGEISVKERLASREHQLLQLFVRAQDQGSPPMHSDVPVAIYVIAEDDQPPYFEDNQPSYFIYENQEIGSIIATVTAHSNHSLKYSIIAGEKPESNNPERFLINNFGKIEVYDALDREVVDSVRLTIRAETETSPALVAETVVTVKIMDINDNPPVFESQHYAVTIMENAEIGSQVLRVEAHDADTGANSDLSYSYLIEDAQISNIFALDAESGQISTLVSLDREARDTYEFSVTASDRGSPPLSSVTLVKISVTDFNDNPPQFEQDEYEGAVNEDALPGTIILMVTSSDADLSPNNQVSYSIREGDPLGQFNVRHTGELYVNKQLDRERKFWYELTLVASDGAHVTSTQVFVSILDANDNAPVCEQASYQKIISEDVDTGSFLLRVSASDADEKGTRNSRIKFLLDGNHGNVFHMNERTGIISIKNSLDRETAPDYTLTVTAVDGGGLFCQSEVYIVVTDVNDNAPVFTQTEYTVGISEHAQKNTLLMRVSASDLDLGLYRKVNYALEDNGGLFKMDQESGIVSLNGELDREAVAQYNISVYAYDQGTVRLSSAAHLIVNVLDENDNPPEFERSVYLESIPEDAAVGSSLLQVTATSLDTGINAQMTYTISEDNALLNLETFSMDPESGILRHQKPLDYETVREYSLTVLATDGGEPPLTASATLNINVTDCNDQAPIFDQSVYRLTIPENTRVGQSILKVSATDLDSAAYAVISYAIGSGDDLGQFEVNAPDGVISVAQPLDRESLSHYSLVILATDTGATVLTGTATLFINLTDVNDCPPRFTMDNFTAVVQEDLPLATSILQMKVTDDDLDPNRGPFTFDIVDGNQDNSFRIDGNHWLITAAQFNRQIQDTFNLTIRAFDHGSPTLYTDTEISVKVIEESAFPPIATPLTATISVFDCEFNGGFIGRVKALDSDIYDRLQFGLVPSEYSTFFAIDQSDGTLRATESLDNGEYTLNVSVSDGKHVVHTTAQLTVLCISEDMASNSVVMRFHYLLPEEFLSVHMHSFLVALKSELSVRTKDIHVLSVQLASDTVVAPRSRRDTDSDLDVLVAVQKSQNKFYRGNALRRRLQQAQNSIEKAMGVEINDIFNDVCEKDTCTMGKCETEIHILPEMFPIVTDEQSFVTARHNLGWYCDCQSGYGGLTCDEQVQLCSPNPCPPYEQCSEGPDGSTYRCECPEGKKGPKCQETVDDVCRDASCRADKPLTFSGNSYVRWRLTVPMERRLSLGLEIKTVQSNARLMHAVGRVDYSILELVDGHVQYRFDCGSGEGLARADTVAINDGYWHSVAVERTSRTVHIIIDGKLSGEGSAPGTNDVLNLDSNDVFFGAEVRVLSQDYEDTKRGFVGCMNHVKVEGVELPLSGGASVGILQNYKDIEFHCRGTYIPGVCSSSPCENGGSCLPLGDEHFMCQCRNRFSGARCEMDNNPCASNPCLHGGSCTNLVNDYLCNCPGRLKGKRCQQNVYCDPNPCKHGAACKDGLNVAICECPPGLQGIFCEHDVDECEQSPCQNGGECHNLHGSFFCNCSTAVSGTLCEEVDLPSIKSSGMNINMDEIFGIIGVAAALIVIAFIFVLVVCLRKRAKRQQESHSSKRDVKTDYPYNYDKLDPQGQPNIPMGAESSQRSPRPPPVPNRPVSYTPSVGDSVNTLNHYNNFDSLRNYGSAADELESLGTMRQPIEIPEFLQNVDADKPLSHAGSPAPIRSLPPPPPYESPADANVCTQNGCYLVLPNANEVVICAPRSGEEEQGYHWDTSDWNPSNPLRKIALVPSKSVPDDPRLATSRDSNLHIAQDEYEMTDCNDDVDSEYVGDSEPSFEEILALQGELNFGDEEAEAAPPRSYSLHPNQYLPQYNISQGSQSQDQQNANYGENLKLRTTCPCRWEVTRQMRHCLMRRRKASVTLRTVRQI
ncbi:hypothetical protein CAPTEDRAFT_222745 [Capitella teleta]|uniref:Uncharacterized protein n=1 Tax=Capitella teleta TaxID=283909 RepID=R7UQ35_CAPTE|nr:hypothetical protein CAPTEDRAFT_222745 [Capitella teleta]|eukprot:ELU08218.1 hypothetical protein CAPTEDRAFT_222745 [Capitella teleta]